jgi:diguanylate cyclase (GGDEF)-like protein
MAAAAGEVAIARGERLATRWPLVVVFGLHACFMLAGLVLMLQGRLVVEPLEPANSWLGLVHFEHLVFLVGSTVFMIGIARERMELQSTTAAHFDSLTGVANRGAFFSRAERLYRHAREDGVPVSLIVFDLDHFKQVNDTYGHLVGDTVLKTFADSAGAVLRPGDLFGRIGGEEFAAILPGAGTETASVVAERVRHAFEAAPKLVSGMPVTATVSAGVATAPTSSLIGQLETTLEAADRALYRAKAFGRNRVERAYDRPPLASTVTVRVA